VAGDSHVIYYTEQNCERKNPQFPGSVLFHDLSIYLTGVAINKEANFDGASFFKVKVLGEVPKIAVVRY